MGKVRLVVLLILWFSTAAFRRRTHSPRSISLRPVFATTAPAETPTDLEVVTLTSVANFRRALPGTNLPIYRAAALDYLTSTDVPTLHPVTTVIDLRNTDEIVKGFSKRPFDGATAWYSSFAVVLDSMRSVELLRAGVNKQVRGRLAQRKVSYVYLPFTFVSMQYYGRPPEAIIGDLHYARPAGPTAAAAATAGRRNRIYQLPLFGSSNDFWTAVKDLTDGPPPGAGGEAPGGMMGRFMNSLQEVCVFARVLRPLSDGGRSRASNPFFRCSTPKLPAHASRLRW